MGHYVGARYVPKFANPLEWAENTAYEAMTVVSYNNNSYTSKVPVPPTVGNPANNPQYWALTGNYNAQVEQYRQETENYNAQVEQYRQETENVKINHSKCFNTAANMIADASLTEGMIVKTLGYNKINDNGGAFYKIYNTKEQNSEHYENLSNGKYALLITNGCITPEMFGAVGDGKTDDTVAIQLALDSNFDVVFNKSYLVTNTITLTKPKSIRGKGNIIANFNSEKSIIYILSDNVTVKDISITSNGYSTGSGNTGAIHADKIKNLIIDSINVDKFNGNAIYITSSRNCKVQNCNLTNLHDNGIFIGGQNANNNTIENNYVDTTIAQNGIFITASPGSTETSDYIYNNTIKNNIVKNAGDTNIESGIHSVNTRIISNNCYGGTNPCILIRDNKNTLVENNYIDTTNQAISLMQQTENLHYINNGIINNNFIKNASIGIYVQQSGFIITNNNIKSGEVIRFAGDSSGIKNITIRDNILDGTFNTNYGAVDYKLENVHIDLLSLMILNSYRTTFKNVTYKQIHDIDSMEQYSTTFFLNNITNKKGFVDVSINDSNGAYNALFKIDTSTSKVYGDSELHDQTELGGFNGYEVKIANDRLEVQRRGATVTNVSMIINFTFA